eukprot:jgi/Tetstr1/425762/TSEL_016181.t1
MPSSSLVVAHLFSPCHGPSASEVEAVVEYGFSILAFIGADPPTEARTMWPHHLHGISNKYPGRLPPSTFQDCHDGTPMNINDITITELERLRPFTLVVSSTPCQSCNVAAIKLADPGPFSGRRIYNPATGRKTPPLSMPAFQFSNADYLMDAFQPSGPQEGPHAPPPMLPLAALASPQEGPPPPHHTEHTLRTIRRGTPRHVPTVRVSTAPRNYQEDISSTRPDDWKKSVNHEINSIITMALFVWVNVPEFRRDNESAVILRTAWAFAAQHEDGNIIKRETGVIVRGNLLTARETYAYDYLPLGCGRKDRAWHPVEALYDLPQASKAWFLCFSSFLHDFGFISLKPGSMIHLHRETCIIDILTTFHMTESKPRRMPCTLNTNVHNTAVT